ncbi:MAG TPA: sigma 54-interacting transcriptional regulator [Vicinamibacterales bacterium]|jgi:hypothetical protein
MQQLSNVVGGATRLTRSLEYDPTLPADCHLAKSAGVNLLVIHHNGSAARFLDQLLSELSEPVASWRPGQQLALPTAIDGGILILQNVGALTSREQERLLAWLEVQAGRVQIVSTTPEPLLPQVEAGSFLDTLYYRLNTVCVDTRRES